jgi:hypothetical protein
MTTRRDHLEVRPVDAKSLRPLFARPHFVRRVAANGRTLHHSQGYATRRGAVRAARRAGDEAGLWVHVLDGDTPPRTIRTYPPRVTR